MNVFLRKAANLFSFPGLDGAGGGNAGGGITAAAGCAGTVAGGRGRGGGIISGGGGVRGFKDGSKLYIYSFNFPEEIRSKYCFKC